MNKTLSRFVNGMENWIRAVTSSVFTLYTHAATSCRTWWCPPWRRRQRLRRQLIKKLFIKWICRRRRGNVANWRVDSFCVQRMRPTDRRRGEAHNWKKVCSYPVKGLFCLYKNKREGALQMGTQTYPDNCSHSCWAQSPPYNRTRTCRRAAHSRAVHKDCPARIVLQRQRKEETKKLGVSFYCVSFMFHENVLLNILPNDPDNWSSVIELHGQCCCTGGIECNRLSTRIS